ncbi:hypothetical protein ALI144C_35665 [Actinosynnema sp. ALI-1.44]|uniref:AurF N-oxygenase family protein n=1 Tax=Actinosynnema sp. ALI-1.44 TaxID=1933779 RepID=UPI00097C8815|nr:diiron oxygenase [Actinosynnema sp. ALI-1.44]ONI76045.1 hypothetical protein ALI144C_35665 [Actinosynnema sp. ALI-1.44]
MAEQLKVGDRETTAQRLLNGTARKFYDPEVDIDWDAPLADGKFFIPPNLVSLYGTRMWDEMSHEQRVELSRQEMMNTVSVGIWFENILNQLLLRMAYKQDPTSRHVHYELAELAEETRHMTMFGMLIDKAGGPAYRNDFLLHNGGKLLPLVIGGPTVWVATLVGEEIFDSLQRDFMNHPDLQPHVQQVMRIHVLEEARHIRFAREDLVRRMARTPWYGKAVARFAAGFGAYLLKSILTRPEVYRRAGLDVRRARREARGNAHIHATYARAFEKLRSFLHDQGLVKGPNRVFWRLAKVDPDGKGVV